ncbi:alpha/beta hydrolase [Streptomyces sp. CB01881]|uniref:alpha/beta fold hydrolase n=1 Tax=Streptomyces sp. CB01881 TaxID=2078691 RepID=UPI000CDC08CF|nr:alpha/beta hydrolase [Streptomyces sp. CB01881]AUY48662.1 alpha/beta hydrolase [Streptomyces sp. CB01881]TYC77156.1 alpha/beta hydrolase [Streptomyces sp. CB01881]
MRQATVTPNGDRIRWVELPGAEPARLFLHGLGASSPVYFAAAAAHPLLGGRRSLLLDLLGFGISDRPADFPYTLEAHADAVAAAVEEAGLAEVEVVGHSMGGAVAIVLAHRHPRLVANLLLVDANLDPIAPARRPGSSGIATFTEEEFLAGGRERVGRWVGPFWWSTMRLAGPEALHRSAVNLARGTVPTMRELLLGLEVPRTFLHPAADGEPAGADRLREAGVELVAVPDCGHNIMFDNPEGFTAAAAAALARRTAGE